MTSQLLPARRFPDCPQCPYLMTGPASVCLPCARPRLRLPAPGACPVCSQSLGSGGNCPNELCRSPRRQIGRIQAIGYQTGPLRQAINSYKYRGARCWSLVFGRLVLAWLDEVMAGDRPDLIVANPSFVGPGGQPFAHTEAVLDAAAAAAAARADDLPRWPFDTAGGRAVVKTAATARSADGEAWSKRAAATELRGALRVPEPVRTEGRFVLVYDDICTTGGQLDAVAACLLDEGGAARVEGIVLARAPLRGQAQVA
jgi:predicted amidophosphoribosyltransferase